MILVVDPGTKEEEGLDEGNYRSQNHLYNSTILMLI
jgi:hypothetical protein